MEDDLKVLKVEYLSNHWSDLPQILNYVTYEFLGGNYRKTQEEISSVALLSPACFISLSLL